MLMPAQLEAMPNIAIIDNEPFLARLYEDALASRGHKVVFVVSSCPEAYEKLKAAKTLPDMIVVSSDHGSELLARIKSEFPSINVKEVHPRKREKMN